MSIVVVVVLTIKEPVVHKTLSEPYEHPQGRRKFRIRLSDAFCLKIHRSKKSHTE